MSISRGLRAEVILRAGSRCEYCRLPQARQEATFHIDHIVPVIAGGSASTENLALACVSCSLRKGARRDAVDPATMQTAALFHPRLGRWSGHFAPQDNGLIAGLSPTGRATVAALAMNRQVAVAIRSALAAAGEWP